jgi:uncharacterized protein YcfJ
MANLAGSRAPDLPSHLTELEVEKPMLIQRGLILLMLGTVFALPLSSNAQETYSQRRHRHAVAAQRASDHRHHTGAKIVGGSAVGGALVGGVMGGGKGALIGGALGAGGGAIANKAREHHDVKKREDSAPR